MAVKMLRRSPAAVVVLAFFCGAGLLADPPASSSPGSENDPRFRLDEEAMDLDLARLSALEHALGNGGGAQVDEGAFPILAGYDSKNGFHIRSEENDFLIRLRGRLQARYTNKAMDLRGSGGDDTDVSAMELERARLGVQGHFFEPWIKFKLEVDAGTDASDRSSLTDAYVYFDDLLAEGNDLFNIGVGQWKPYFIWQEKTSSSALQMVDRSLMTEFFSIDRNIGLWVDGSSGPFEYEFGMTNGFDSVNEPLEEIDHSPAFFISADYNVLRSGGKNMSKRESDYGFSEEPGLVVGGGFAMDHNNTTALDPQLDFSAYMANAHAVFKYLGASLQGEYVARWMETDSVGTRLTPDETFFAHGLYVQGGYMLMENFEVGGRFSTVWNDGPAGSSGNAVEVGPVFNYFISGNHNVKLQLDAVYVDIPESMQPATERLVASAAPGDFGEFGSGSTNLRAGDQGVVTRVQVQVNW